jgi:hypothetical protein
MLRPPSRTLSQIALPTVRLAASKLYRISRFASGEPYFGRSGANRFDDPSTTKKHRFGTCYFGLSLTVAVAESVLHDEMPNRRGEFEIAAQEFEDRYLVRFTGGDLVLVNLTGAALKRLAGDGSMSTVMPYALPQRWSRAIHRHPQAVDGIVYMSRHVNDERAVVLFDRAASKLHSVRYQPLPKAKGAAQTLIDLRIVFKYA